MEAKHWREDIVDVLQEFSSAEFQDRVWLKGLGPEVSSYEEAMCHLFDDLQLLRMIDVEWRQLGLTETQRNALKDFQVAIDKFDENISKNSHPLEVLQNPSWPTIRELAEKTAKLLT